MASKTAPADAGATQTQSMGREGGKMKVYHGRDNSSFKLPNTMGGKMGGSITNLSHSLSDDRANQKGPR